MNRRRQQAGRTAWQGADSHVHVAGRVRRPARREPGGALRLVLERRRRGAERTGGNDLLGRRRKRPSAAGPHVRLRRADRRPSAVRPDRRLGRQPPLPGYQWSSDLPAAAEGAANRFRGPPSPAASRRRSRRRRSSLATSSSRSPVPRSSSRRSTSASSTSSASARCPCCSARASATSASSSAATSCSRTSSWCRAPGRSTSATPCDADGRTAGRDIGIVRGEPRAAANDACSVREAQVADGMVRALLRRRLAALTPSLLFCAVVPPCFGLPPVPDFFPPCFDASGEFAIFAARSLDMPLSCRLVLLVVLHVRRLRMARRLLTVPGLTSDVPALPIAQAFASSKAAHRSRWPSRRCPGCLGARHPASDGRQYGAGGGDEHCPVRRRRRL